MKILKTPIKDLIIIKNKRFDDSRGYFRELIKQKFILVYETKFIPINFIYQILLMLVRYR